MERSNKSLGTFGWRHAADPYTLASFLEIDRDQCTISWEGLADGYRTAMQARPSSERE